MFSFNFSLLIFNFLGTIDIVQVRHLMTDLFQLVLEFVLDRPCSRLRYMSMKPGVTTQLDILFLLSLSPFFVIP